MLVSLLNFKYLPQKKDLVVYTYEVKKYSSGNLRDTKSVFEAASHQKGAHYSYLVIENSERNSKDPVPEELADTLERFGVGFAWFFKLQSGEYDLQVVLEPKLQTPSRTDVNKYIVRFIGALGEKERADLETSI